MSDFLSDQGPIFQAKTMLSDVIPLHVYLVRGANYAVWIDSGVKAMFPQLVEVMGRAGVANADLRFVLHTHSHHDHIGCNAQLHARTGCLVAAPANYAAWHADFEQHYQEFARPFPHLIPDTPDLRDEVLSILDAPHPLDLIIDEGVRFNLGGGVTLTAHSLPGHMLAEFGWFEESTRTLILGDADHRAGLAVVSQPSRRPGLPRQPVENPRLVADFGREAGALRAFPADDAPGSRRISGACRPIY